MACPSPSPDRSGPALLFPASAVRWAGIVRSRYDLRHAVAAQPVRVIYRVIVDDSDSRSNPCEVRGGAIIERRSVSARRRPLISVELLRPRKTSCNARRLSVCLLATLRENF